MYDVMFLCHVIFVFSSCACECYCCGSQRSVFIRCCEIFKEGLSPETAPTLTDFALRNSR